MPESNFETFVREALTEVRENGRKMADALWDLIPRVKKLENRMDLSDQKLAKHDGVFQLLAPIIEKAATPPPPPTVVQATSIPPLPTLGKASKSGNYPVSPEVWTEIDNNFKKANELALAQSKEIEALKIARQLEERELKGAKDALKKAEDSKDRTFRILAVCIAGAVAIGYLVSWLVSHVPVIH